MGDYRAWLSGILLLIILTTISVVGGVKGRRKKRRQDQRKRLSTMVWKGRLAYLFLLPMFLIVGVFDLYPIIRGSVFLFLDYRFISPPGTKFPFVGLANFWEAFHDRAAGESFLVSLRFVYWSLPLGVLIPLLIAILISRIRSKSIATIFRTIFYIPVVIPLVVATSIWYMIISPDFGLLTSFLEKINALLGTEWTQNILASTTLLLPTIAIMSVWKGMGFNMLLFLVGLNNISEEVVESARLDGASEWKLFWTITLPLLKPIFMIVLFFISVAIGAMAEMMLISGPGNSTRTYALYSWEVSFWGDMRFGYGTALGYMLGLLSITLSFMTFRLLRTRRA